MLNFRQFEAGPDPFGHKFQALFQWLQTAISLRNADTIDVKFTLVDEAGVQTAKTIALPRPGVIRAAAQAGRAVDDAWCARLAALHLLRLVRTGDDMEKDLVAVSPADLERHAAELASMERPEARVG
jgi:hypothetical protein